MPALDDVANPVARRICLEIGLDGRDGLELFGFVVGDELGELLFQQLVLGLEARDEAEDLFQDLAQGEASVHGGGPAQLGQRVVLFGLVEDFAVDVVDDPVPPSIRNGRRDGFVLPHGILEFLEEHPVDLHPLVADGFLHHSREDVAAQVLVGAGASRRPRNAAVALLGRRQSQDFVVVELGLEVLAVAEEIEEFEGFLVRVGDGLLDLLVEKLLPGSRAGGCRAPSSGRNR